MLNTLCATDKFPEVAIWGDSNAMHLVQGFVASYKKIKLVQHTKSGCAPILKIAKYQSTKTRENLTSCISFNNSVMDYILKNKSIKYVVLSSSFLGYFGEGDTVLDDTGSFVSGSEVSYANLVKTVKLLKKNGKKPILFAPPPKPRDDIQACLDKSIFVDYDFLDCDFSLENAVYFQEPFYDALLNIERILSVVYLHKAICPQGLCRVHPDGILLFRDSGHLAIEGSKYLGKKMNFYSLIKSEF